MTQRLRTVNETQNEEEEFGKRRKIKEWMGFFVFMLHLNNNL